MPKVIFGPGSGGGGGSTDQTFTAVAAEALGVGDLVSFIQSGDGAGKVQKANSSAAKSSVVGVCITAVNAGQTATVQTDGETNVNLDSAPLSSQNGNKVYIGSTDGQGTLTIRTQTGNSVVEVGFIRGANGITSSPSVLIKLRFVINLT
jgi:hypothetical protein